MKKKIFILLKVAVSCALLGYLLTKVDIKVIFQSIKSASIFWLLFAIFLNGVGKVISALRWKYLLSVQSINVPIMTLIKSLFVGHFFNIFLPTTVGGDVVRAYDVSKISKKTAQSVSTVVVERMMGILALVILAILGILLGMQLEQNVSAFIGAILGVFFLSISGFFVIFNRSLVAIFIRFLNHFKLAKLRKKILSLHEAFILIRGNNEALMKTFIYSFALQINVVLHYYLIGKAINFDVSVCYFFIIIPVVLIILMLPISINGIGLRENAYVMLLGVIGITAQNAIALSWIAFGIILMHGLVGGVVYVFRH